MLNNTNVFGVSMEEIEHQIERNAERVRKVNGKREAKRRKEAKEIRKAILENSFNYEVSEEEINYHIERNRSYGNEYSDDLSVSDREDSANVEILKGLLAENFKLSYEDLDMRLSKIGNRFKRYRGRIKSYYTAKIDIDKDIIKNRNGRYEVSLKDAEAICIQESNMTIKLGLNGFMNDVFVLKLKSNASNEATQEANSLVAEDIIKNGLYIDGKKYKILTQTAAQGRVGKFYIAPASKVHKYRKAIANGVDYTGSKKVVSKLEKRISLGLSSGYPLAKTTVDGKISRYYDYTVKYVDDVKRELDLILAVPNEECVDGVWRFTKDKEGKSNEALTLEYVKAKFAEAKKNLDKIKDALEEAKTEEEKERYKEYREYKQFKTYLGYFQSEVTDGFGLVDIRTAAHWAYQLGTISKGQLNYFRKHFKGFNKKEIEKDEALSYVLENIPTAYQVRHQFDKGLLVIWDLKAEGIKEDTLMCKSMHKESEEAKTDSVWRICNYNKPKGNFNYLSYQSLQKLCLPDDLMRDLGDRTIQFLTRALQSADGAIEFLNIHDVDLQDDSQLNSKLIKILTKNPEAICSGYVQEKMKKLIEKQIHLAAIGKVVIPGAYYYMCPDPRVLFGRKTLKSGANYFNGFKGQLGLVRYPCVSYIEPQKLNFKDDKELWFLRDLVVFNPFDGRWIGMGGADFDGDICLVIMDQRIVDKMIDYDPMVNIVTHNYAKEEIVDDETLTKMFLDSYKGSEVGTYSNYVTKFISKCEHVSKGVRINRISKIGVLSPLADMVTWTFIIGKEIDRAKTYESFIVPQEMIEFAKSFKPDWMIAVSELKKGVYDFDFSKKVKDDTIKSNCTMGRYFRYMKDKYSLFTGKGDWARELDFSDEQKFVDMLQKHVDIDSTFANIFNDMKEIYKDYTNHMSILAKLKDTKTSSMKEDFGFDEEDEEDATILRNKMFEAVFEDYRERFEITCRDKNYDRYVAAYACIFVPYLIDKANKDKVIVDDKTGKIRKGYKVSKAFAFNIAFDYLLDILAVANNGTFLAKIPETNKKVIEVVNGYIFQKGMAFKTRLEDGIYNVINNNRGSFVDVDCTEVSNPRVEKGMSEEEVIALRDKINNAGKILDGYKQLKGFEDKFRFTLVNTKSYNTNPKALLTSLLGKEFVVGKEKGHFTLITIENGKLNVLANLKGLTNDVVGKKFTLAEDVLTKCNFYNAYRNKGSRLYSNGRIVREAVAFGANFVSEVTEKEAKLMNLIKEESSAIIYDDKDYSIVDSKGNEYNYEDDDDAFFYSNDDNDNDDEEFEFSNNSDDDFFYDGYDEDDDNSYFGSDDDDAYFM